MVSHAFGAAVAEFYDMSFAADDQRLALEASGVEYEPSSPFLEDQAQRAEDVVDTFKIHSRYNVS